MLKLAALILANPVEFAATFVQRHPDVATLNRARHAVQIAGCTEGIIAGHIDIAAPQTPEGVAMAMR